MKSLQQQGSSLQQGNNKENSQFKNPVSSAGYASTTPAYKTSYYKRCLPTPPCIDFASTDGKRLFLEAMTAGHMEGFFKLIQQFTTQGEPTYCGIASVCIVLNAMEIDPRRVWRGAWRFFGEDMLDCCKPLDQIKKEGITLQQAACLATCNGAHVETHHSGTFSLEAFRETVASVTSSGHDHLVASYCRSVLTQTGSGHFSPIGGFHPESDHVLILDTARFKYPPHWVPLTMLYDAMGPLDSTTGQPRGYLHLSHPDHRCSLLLRLSIQGNWRPAHTYATQGCVDVAAAALRQGMSAQQVVVELVRGLPHLSVLEMVVLRDRFMCNSSVAEGQKQVLHELRQLDIFSVAQNALQDLSMNGNVTVDVEGGSSSGTTVAERSCGGMITAERIVVMLFLCSDALKSKRSVLMPSDSGESSSVEELLVMLDGVRRSSLVTDEVQFLKSQLEVLPVISGSELQQQRKKCGCFD